MAITEICPEKVFQQRLEDAFGLKKYSQIMKSIGSVDISKDREFQRLFNGFYRVRRNEEWQEKYYRLFADLRCADVDFRTIFTELYRLTGTAEVSFSSKMLATLKPEKTLWDRYIIEKLELTVPGNHAPNRAETIIGIYRRIEEWYEQYLSTDNAIVCINTWDKMLPDYAWISPQKKIDFFLWSIR